MEKTITICGKDVTFKASALTPRLYRHWIGRDMVRDMNSLRKAFTKLNNLPADATDEERVDAELSVMDLEVFESVAWVMARQADPTVKDNPDEWLDEFDMFSIYEIMPHILMLWGMNEQTTSKAKKK